jgi:hypothetical protein
MYIYVFFFIWDFAMLPMQTLNSCAKVNALLQIFKWLGLQEHATRPGWIISFFKTEIRSPVLMALERNLTCMTPLHGKTLSPSLLPYVWHLLEKHPWPFFALIHTLPRGRGGIYLIDKCRKKKKTDMLGKDKISKVSETLGAQNLGRPSFLGL